MQRSKLNHGEVTGEVTSVLVLRKALKGPIYQTILSPHGLEGKRDSDVWLRLVLEELFQKTESTCFALAM